MGTLDLQEGESARLKIQAQYVKGYPQTVGDLYLTNHRMVLLPNQALSIGFGKRWECHIGDIQDVQTKKPLQGGPFVGSAGKRITIILKDGSQHTFSSLGDVTPLYRALYEQITGQVAQADTVAQESRQASSTPLDEVGTNRSQGVVAQPGTVYPSSPPKDPVLAALISLVVIGGGGQIYLGQTKKGVAIIIVSLALSCVGIGVVTWLLGVVDAYLIAKRLKSGEPVGEMQFF